MCLYVRTVGSIHGLQQFSRQEADTWSFALTWARDIQRFDTVLTQPRERAGCHIGSDTSIDLDDEIRLGELLGNGLGCKCPAFHFADIDDQGAITFLDIAARSLTQTSNCQFRELVFQWDGAVLSPTSARRTATVGVSVRHGEIQRPTICAGLPAGDDALAEARRLREIRVQKGGNAQRLPSARISVRSSIWWFGSAPYFI